MEKIDKLKMLSLFSGIGAFEESLDNLKIPYELVNYSEINPQVSKCYNVLRNENPEKNLGDIFKIDETKIPSFDFMTYGFPCFVKGTLVLTKEGYKPIENIQNGEYVLTHTNQFKKVVEPMKKETTFLYDVKISALPNFGVTAEHPFYVLKTKKDVIPEWVETKDLTPEMYVGMAINKESILPTHKNERINNDLQHKDFWFYFGIWLYYYKNGEVENFNKNRTKITKNEITSLTCAKFSKKTFNYFEGNDGFIYKTLMDLPIDYLQKFLLGFLLKNNMGSTVPKYINKDKELIFTLTHCFYKAFKKVMQVEELEDNTYCIKIKPNSTKYSFELNDYLWTKVLMVNGDVVKPTMVYNMEVEEDNSYVVQGVIVHNCQSFSMQGKRLGFEDPTKGPLFFESMRIVKYHQPKYLIAENVTGLFTHDKGNTFSIVLKTLEDLNYNNYYAILDSSKFGIPQSRERVFIVSIRKDIDDGTFEMPIGLPTSLTVRDILDDIKNRDNVTKSLKPYVDEKYFINEYRSKSNIKKYFDGNKEGYFTSGFSSHRIYGIDGYSPTLTTKNDAVYYELNGKLNHRERFALHGFPKEYADKLLDAGVSKGTLDLVTGNTITVNVIMAILENLFLK